MTFAERIYNGETPEELGMGQYEYDSRKAINDKFLTVWDGKNFNDSFLAWLPTQDEGKVDTETAGMIQAPPEGHPLREQPLPSKFQMAKNLLQAGKDAVKAGFVMVSDEEKEKRLAICEQCEHLMKGKRCALCGCWVEFKSGLEVWHCPIKKW